MEKTERKLTDADQASVPAGSARPGDPGAAADHFCSRQRICGVLQADADGKLPVWLYSDPGNTVWVKLRILDAGGNRIGETGLLKPGEYVETVQLAESAQAGNVTLHVMGYEPETYYSGGAVDFQTTLTLGQ